MISAGSEHLEETGGQIERLDAIFELIDKPAKLAVDPVGSEQRAISET